MPEIYVVSDGSGFVLATYDVQQARDIMAKYSTPFVVQKFASGAASVWVVLYRDINAVAFASDSRERAVEVQRMYIKAGLTYEDSVDYWEQTAGVVSESALARLQSRDCLQEKLADMCGAEQKLFDSADAESGPLAMLIREHELITIQDAVCDADSEAAGETAN